MATKVYLEWENVTQNWELVDQFWEEVILIQEVANLIKRGGSNGSISDYVRGNPWEKTREALGEEKTKKFIKIFARVNGLDYGEIYESKSEIKVTVEQMQKVFDETEKIGVKITF